MAVRQRSEDLKALRGSLGLEPQEFAQVLGVHPSTVYRWEASSDPPNISAFQSILLDGIGQAVEKLGAAKLGAKLLRALNLGGGLYALHTLLCSLYPVEEKIQKKEATGLTP